MPAKGIHHVDLAVADVARSLTFYLGLLGPLGWVEEVEQADLHGCLVQVGERKALRPVLDDRAGHRQRVDLVRLAGLAL